MNYHKGQMEKTPVRDISEICRTCLGVPLNVHNINDTALNGVKIITLLESLCEIKIEDPDRLPQNMCIVCITALHTSYRFKRQCLDNDAALKSLIQEADKVAENKFNAIETYAEDDGDSLSAKEATPCAIQSTENSDDDDTDYFERENENVPKKSDEVAKPPESSTLFRSKIIHCTQCLERFETKEMLLEHRKKTKHGNVRKYPCEICAKMFAKCRMREHMISHTKEKLYQCEICASLISSYANFRRHLKGHAGERPFVCHVCGARFTQKTSLVSHKKAFHGIGLAEGENPRRPRRIRRYTKAKSDEIATDKFTCEVCGRHFKVANAYKAHLDKHSKDRDLPESLSYSDPSYCKGRDFVCEVCLKRFKKSYDLRKHQKFHEAKNYLCSECGMSFHSNRALDGHFRVHSGVKPFACTICEKSFSHASCLKIHENTHFGLRPYTCEYCSKTFTASSNLLRHLKIHSGVKPYKCSFCEKSFTLNATLKVHLRIHTGETPYSCTICMKQFNESRALKNHNKRYHEKNEIDSGCSIGEESIESSSLQ